MNRITDRISFFRSPPHDCGYFLDRRAETIFAHPESYPDRSSQTVLAKHGFRRSGKFLYRPACLGCSACIPVRIPVSDFRLSRSQKRVLARNHDLKQAQVQLLPTEERLELYQRYQSERHPDGQMLATSNQNLLDFFDSPWSDTRFTEFRLDEQLICVSISDRLDDAWSAVYTFFDPRFAKRSLGTLAILNLLSLARSESLDWVYLGYWIADSPKMNYKNRFRPMEKFVDGNWLSLESVG
ncbi:MAG: arginyltransferase [Gammaproteobacteria bacterium]